MQLDATDGHFGRSGERSGDEMAIIDASR